VNLPKTKRIVKLCFLFFNVLLLELNLIDISLNANFRVVGLTINENVLNQGIIYIKYLNENLFRFAYCLFY